MAPKFYVDTSLIIARYKPADELHEDSESFFRRGSEFYASNLTLVELYSVLSRAKEELELPSTKGNVLSTLVAFILEDCRLRMIRGSRMVERTLLGQRFRVPPEYHSAMEHAEELRLRTLDLIHLAHARRTSKESDIRAFVTGDEEILERRDVIRRAFGLRVLHPSRANR